MDKNLFGERIIDPPQKCNKHEKSILKYDEETFEGKVLRLQYLDSIFPKGLLIAGDMEFLMTFSEIKNSFIHGDFIATIILTQSFIEKMLTQFLIDKGYENKVWYGLDAMIKCARKHSLTHNTILDMIDSLRLKRNPFVHYKSKTSQPPLSLRAYAANNDPMVVLEKDAMEGLQVLFHLLKHNF